MSVSDKIPEQLHNLPIADVVPQVIRALITGNVLLHAAPGAGKSTGLPLALLPDSSVDKRIVMLEPRRLAARSVAERLAAQLKEPLGQQVGLRMRGHTVVSSRTRLEVVTEGVLTRMLQSDPTLDGVALVIFDEFHERSLHADLGLTLCLEVQQALRGDLRLLLMSATLDASQLNTQLKSAQQIFCTARQHPVDIHWWAEGNESLSLRVAKAATSAVSKEAGDILVFLPGVAEIEKTASLLQSRLTADTQLLRLHGGVDSATQRAATAKSSPSHRRVILSTSIAETSLTIDGVRVVIDAGLERRGRIDNTTGAVRLETVMASQASATQRAGRAGRTMPGVCYRLWSESGHSRRAVSWQPEILRADLSPFLMELGQWGATSIADLPWLEQPPVAALARAEMVLARLGVWQNGQLTAHGRAVAGLPVHPRLGHMLLWAAERGVGELACELAVVLEDGGHMRRGVDIETALQVPLPQYHKRRIEQLRKLVTLKSAETVPSLAVILAQAYPDWIAQRRPGIDARFALSCGAGVVMKIDDTLAHCDWLSVGQLGGSGRDARIFAACSLSIDDLETWAPHLLASKKHLEWDDRLERVVAEEQTVVGELVVRSRSLEKVSTIDRATALLSGIRSRGLQCLPWTDEHREWQARVQLVRSLPAHCSQLTWPMVDDESLHEHLDEWLLPWLDGIGNLKSLSRLDLSAVLKAMLEYRQQQELEELLPSRFTVPSGSQIRLRYSASGNPVLSVKLQEMFGCIDNPAVGKGHVPLTVELLSPARRPIQITEDLANFWTNSYPAVKKDLAGRYPKHHWPDNPLVAVPTAKAKPRKRRK